MKKFLSLLMAALMLLSVAVAEAIPSPSANSEMGIVNEPSKSPSVEGTVTSGLFAANQDPAAIEMAKKVLDTIKAAATPTEAYSAMTQTVVLEALGAEAKDVKLAAAPMAITVNEEVATTANGDQVLMLTNIPVGSKFVVVLNVKTGNEVSEIVLTEVDADPATMQVYAKVDEKTMEQLRAADLVIVTVLTVI